MTLDLGTGLTLASELGMLKRASLLVLLTSSLLCSAAKATTDIVIELVTIPIFHPWEDAEVRLHMTRRLVGNAVRSCQRGIAPEKSAQGQVSRYQGG